MFIVQQFSVSKWVGAFSTFFTQGLEHQHQWQHASYKDLPRCLKMNDRWPPTEFVYFWQKSIISFPKMTSQHHYLNLGFDDPSLSIWLTKQDTFLKFIVPSAAYSYPSPKMCSWCLRVFMQSSIRWLFWENNLGLKTWG